MAYSTAAKVRQMCTGVPASYDTTITAHIVRADSIINAKLSVRYSVPFATTPPLIETISTMLASYFTMLAQFTGDSVNRSEWTLEYKTALQMLNDIAEGVLPILTDAGVQLALNGDPVSSNNKDYTPVFDMGDIIDSRVDPDLITEISNEKA